MEKILLRIINAPYKPTPVLFFKNTEKLEILKIKSLVSTSRECIKHSFIESMVWG